MSDIVERLRSVQQFGYRTDIGQTCHEAADTITSLRSQLEEARENALEEAAKVAEKFEAEYANERDKHVHGTPDHWMNNSGSYAAMDIAAAIRKLKEKP